MISYILDCLAALAIKRIRAGVGTPTSTYFVGWALGQTNCRPATCASVVAVIAAIGFVAIDRAPAAEMQVISSDATARFMALGVSKSVTIDLPTDLENVVVADKEIVTAVVDSKRRVYVIGKTLGQTNVYFYDADGRQIGALDVAVQAASQPAGLENYALPANVVVIYFGGGSPTEALISCTPIRCIDTHKPGSDQPPGTINIRGAGAAVQVPAGK